MRFHPLALPGAFLIEPEPRHDERGFFARTWCRDEMAGHGIHAEWTQCNVSFNKKRGTLRGLQFSLKNRTETVRFIARDYKLQEPIADKVYASLLPAMSENGLATDRGLKVMVETLGTAVGKNVDFPPERLVDYSLLREVQKEMGLP